MPPLTYGNTFYKWAAGFDRPQNELAFVSHQPQCEGFVYGTRRYAVSGRAKDEGSTTTAWTWTFLANRKNETLFWPELIAFFEEASDGDANVPMTILTRKQDDQYALCNAWMEMPIAGQDARRNKRRFEQVVVRFNIVTAAIVDPE